MKWVYHVYPSLASTQSLLKSQALDLPEGTVIVALSQTQGMGRGGRSWESPLGGLYASFLLKPPALLPDLPIWLLASLLYTLEDVTGATLTLKWPNDILYQGRKLAGQLIDSQILGGFPRYYVCGVGINLQPTLFSAELQPTVCTLADIQPGHWEWEPLLNHLLGHVASLYQMGQTSATAAWHQIASVLAHRQVQMDYNDTVTVPFHMLIKQQGPQPGVNHDYIPRPS